MKIITRSSAAEDPETLAAELTDGVAPAPDFLSLHASATTDLAGLRDAVLRRTGAPRLHGGTSCRGVMTGAGARLRPGAGLFAIHDPDGAYGVGSARIADDPRIAGRAAAAAALADAGRPGEQPDLLWITAAPGAEEAVLAGIADAVGAAVPVIGASAADDDVAGLWRMVDARADFRDGVVVSALFPSTPFGFAYQNGYAQTEHAGVATRASGRLLREIDGRPARAVLAEWSGGALAPEGADASILSASTFHPLARGGGDAPLEAAWRLLAHPATAHADGAVTLFADVAQGEALRMMRGTPDGLVSRAARVARLARDVAGLDAAPPAGALMVYCGGCMMAVEGRMDEVAADVAAAVDGAPFLGVFSFGEQGMGADGCNAHGNLMISCVVFGA
ncbi:MAG: FIST signal transduction protein [Rubrimonas sp.]